MSDSANIQQKSRTHHMLGPKTTRADVTDRRMAQQRRRTGQFDPTSLVLMAFFATGLITIALAGWLIFALPQQNAQREGGGLHSSVSIRLLHAEQTRDAQQHEIAQLYQDLDQAQQALATATALNAVVPSTPVPQRSSITLEKPPLALILDAPVYKQQRSLSCESSAAAMAANFYGVRATEDAIVSALPRHDNPHHGFRGNIDGPYGGLIDYGVYAEPIRNILAQWGLDVQHFAGGVDEIKQHIRTGRVVIAWVTYNMQIQSPTRVTTSDGQVVTLVPYEHAVLVIGYNRNGLWVNDPYAGVQTFYTEHDFARSFSYLGNMGLVVGPPPS